MIKSKGFILVDTLIAVFIALGIVNLVYFTLSSKVKLNETIENYKILMNEEIKEALLNSYECEICIVEEE